MRRVFTVSILASTIVAYACSESTEGVTPSNTDGGGASSSGGSSGAGSSSGGSSSGGSSGSSGFDATTTVNSEILVNEISGGDEWIEIANSGSSDIDISGWRVADRDKDTGEAKLKDAVTLPSGTTLAAKAYGMVRGGGIDGGKPCPDGGQSFCFNAEFGISNKNGETIYLLAPDAAVMGTTVYPPEAGAGGETWCRIPNADPKGDFKLCTETPGAANQAK